MQVAIVLPGASYGPDMPGLAIPLAALRSRGATVVCVEYPERREQIVDTVTPQIASALVGATEVTVVAKSMGTSVFGDVRELFPPSTRAIWITPLFGDPDVRRNVIASGFGCLAVFALDDPAHDPEGQAAVTAACQGAELCFDVGGHRLTMNDEQRDQLAATLAEFVA